MLLGSPAAPSPPVAGILLEAEGTSLSTDAYPLLPARLCFLPLPLVLIASCLDEDAAVTLVLLRARPLVAMVCEVAALASQNDGADFCWGQFGVEAAEAAPASQEAFSIARSAGVIADVADSKSRVELDDAESV